MAETTPKRVLPARERRESFKLQASSPPAPAPAPVLTNPKIPTPAQTPDGEPRVKRKYVRRAPLKSQLSHSRNSTPASEEALPTRVTTSKPLPTVQNKPEFHASTKGYQSIAESAILAASLHRSRLQWLCDGVFDRYWTKPSKRKGAPEIAANNPEQKSMQRLGNCTITIEPHVFDAVVYTVRDPLGPSLPYARHPNQYPPKHQSPLIQQHPPFFTPPMVPSPQLGPPVNYPPPNSLPPPPPPPPHQQARPPPQPQHPPQKKVKQENGTTASASTAGASTPDLARPASNRSQQAPDPPSARKTTSIPHTPPPKPNADPVIQMLASRAATDSRLKDLMKVVATSKATPAQLKEFQGHIDEFNAVIKRGEVEQAQREREQHRSQAKVATPAAPSQLDGSADEKTQSRSNAPPQTFTPSAAHPATYASNHAPPQQVPIRLGGHESSPIMPMHPPQYAPYPPAPRPEALVKHIVLELTSPASSTQPASQDRWLFPEYAVLDTPMSGRGLEMVCSFFVERKGSQLVSAHAPRGGEETVSDAIKWKEDAEYYQPVTMTVRASQHRTLETIARAAKPLPQVQAYMTDVMKKKVRAPAEHLVLQLPVEKKGDVDVPMVDFTDSAVEMSADEDDELRDFYGV